MREFSHLCMILESYAWNAKVLLDCNELCVSFNFKRLSQLSNDKCDSLFDYEATAVLLVELLSFVFHWIATWMTNRDKPIISVIVSG